MSVIRISSVTDEKRTSKAGKPYTVRLVQGTKYGSDDAWEQPIFTNNKKIIRELDNFGIGDVADFKYEENGKYHDLVAIVEPDPDLIAKIDSGEVTVKKSSKSTGGPSNSYKGNSGSSSDKMSKAEWAEKDRLTNLRIAKAVALKAAILNTKLGTPADSLISWAEEFIPWLLDTSTPAKSEEPADAGGDPLDPDVSDIF